MRPKTIVYFECIISGALLLTVLAWYHVWNRIVAEGTKTDLTTTLIVVAIQLFLFVLVAWRAPPQPARVLRCQAQNRWPLERIYEMFPRLKERHGSRGTELSGGEQQMLAIARAHPRSQDHSARRAV